MECEAGLGAARAARTAAVASDGVRSLASPGAAAAPVGAFTSPESSNETELLLSRRRPRSSHHSRRSRWVFPYSGLQSSSVPYHSTYSDALVNLISDGCIYIC